MFGKAFSQGSRLSFGESNVLCGFSTAWGSVLPTPALLKGHPYRWRDVYFKELTHLPWGYQVWDVKPAGDPRSPRRCPEPTGSMEQERHPLRIGWPRGLLKPVVEFPGQLGKSQVHCMGSGGRVMVCGARALRPHCNHHHLPSSENSRQPLPIPTESDSSPGDSNAHRVGSQLCREKRGGGSGNNQKGTAPHISELSAQTLLRLTDSLHTFTSPSVPAGITPNHSRTLACYRNPEHSVEAPLLSASKDKVKSMLFNGFSYLESWSSGNSTHDYKDENQPERYPMCEKWKWNRASQVNQHKSTLPTVPYISVLA